MSKTAKVISLILVLAFGYSCEKDQLPGDGLYSDREEGPKPYYLPIPAGFPEYDLDEDHLLTEEGVELGRYLFYDPILSKNQNVSCASCHKQEYAFSDPDQFSLGTHGGLTGFHSMPLFNIGWMDQFFWDGRAPTREDQALKPVVNPVEMGMTWPEAIERLENHEFYPEMFKAAFGTAEIDSNMVADALVQFEMTIISSNSKFDRVRRGEAEFSPLEQRGEALFNSNTGADCWHCHMTANVQLSDNSFHNNGLDAEGEFDMGLYAVTGNELDKGKFKTPSLRNLAFTAPYMHDGRFETLDDVIEFYSTGVHSYPGVDPFMELAENGGVNLSQPDREALKAFLLALTDSSLLTNEKLSNPF